MKLSIAICCIVVSIQFISAEDVEAKRKSFCEPREPKINYVQAIEIAKEKLVTYQSVESAFIDLVRLDCSNKKHTWVIGFRRKSYESGHMLIYVSMDGTTKISVVKDG